MLAGKIQLTDNGTVHLGVVSNYDTGFVRQVFGAVNFCFWIEQLDQSADDFVYYR